MTCNTPFWPLLGLTDGQIDPIRSCQAVAPICFIPTVLLNMHSQQVPNPYLLSARRRWLRVNCVERIEFWPVLRTWNCQQLENILSARVYWSCIPVSTKTNGFHWYIPDTSLTPLVGNGEHETIEKYTAPMAYSNKKDKQKLSE